MKVIFHLDLDSYFVSAERTINASLKNKAVIISSSDKRGVVSAASYEAKQKGIYVPMPFYKAKALLPDVIVVSPNFALYSTLSSKVFEHLEKKYTKKIEIASIDECYMDVTEIWKKYGSPAKLAKHMQNSLLDDLKLPASIGIAENKFVAKMSTNINKPLGITITRPGTFLEVFGEWDVIKYYGIGLPTAKVLEEHNIFTIKDLSKANHKELEAILGKRTTSLIEGANGIGSDVVVATNDALKGIGHSTTFLNKDKYQKNDILSIYSDLSKLVSHRAIKNNMVGRVVSISIKKTGNHEIKAKSKQTTLTRAINKYEDIFSEVVVLFDQLWDEKPIKFVGVHLGRLNNIFETTYQTSLWDETILESPIEKIINDVNRKMKSKVVVSGKEGSLNLKRKLKQRRYMDSNKVIKYFDKDKK